MSCKQILLTSTKRNAWRRVLRISACRYLAGLTGLKSEAYVFSIIHLARQSCARLCWHANRYFSSIFQFSPGSRLPLSGFLFELFCYFSLIAKYCALFRNSFSFLPVKPDSRLLLTSRPLAPPLVSSTCPSKSFFRFPVTQRGINYHTLAGVH